MDIRYFKIFKIAEGVMFFVKGIKDSVSELNSLKELFYAEILLGIEKLRSEISDDCF